MTSKAIPSHRVIAAGIAANVPVHIEGNAGGGKTSSLAQWGKSWGRHVGVITGAVRDKGDFMGIPVEDAGVVQYSPPAWVRQLQQAPSGLLVLDELTSSSESFPLMHRIVQEREIGEAPLHEDVAIVAISNPAEYATDGVDIPPALANRFMHVQWQTDFDVWAEGLITDFKDVPHPNLRAITNQGKALVSARAQAQAAVTAFLRSRGDLREDMPTDPVAMSKGWPSYRSWHNLVRVLTHLPEADHEARHLATIGLVGNGAGVDFLTWLSAQDLYDPNDVLDDPTIVNWKDRPDRLYALMASLRSLVLADDGDYLWSRASAVVEASIGAGVSDLAAPLVKTLVSRVPDREKVSRAISNEYSELLGRVGVLI